MMTTSSCAWLLLAAATMQAVLAIGPCNNTLVNEIMAANAEDCPTDILERMYSEGPQVTFRVMSQRFATLFSCATGVLDRPDTNAAVLYNKFSFTDTSLGHDFVNYTMIEAKCGFLYKYIKEESYVGFKITYAYDDGISFGYYGCTDEDSNFSSDSDIYSMCYAPSIDSKEVEESLLKCKAHMELVTGVTDLVLTPACDNDNEYLDDVLAKKKFDWLRRLVGLIQH